LCLSSSEERTERSALGDTRVFGEGAENGTRVACAPRKT
jgi:hypothetical protein